MSSDTRRPKDNPLLPSRQEVKEFNPHHGSAFGYNRALLASENVDAEIARLKSDDSLTDGERRLVYLLEAMFWVHEDRNLQPHGGRH